MKLHETNDVLVTTMASNLITNIYNDIVTGDSNHIYYSRGMYGLNFFICDIVKTPFWFFFYKKEEIKKTIHLYPEYIFGTKNITTFNGLYTNSTLLLITIEVDGVMVDTIEITTDHMTEESYETFKKLVSYASNMIEVQDSIRVRDKEEQFKILLQNIWK